MKFAHTRILSFLVVAICCATPAYAQLGSIFGKVLDKDGKPMAGASVTIDRDEVKYHVDVKTDKSGIYSRLGMEDGSYKVSLMQNGAAIGSDIVVVRLGMRSERDFDLRLPDSLFGSGVAPGAAPINKAQQEAEKKLNSDTKGAFAAGVTALTAKNFDEAIKQLTNAGQLQPKSALIFGRLAEAYAGARKNNEAIDAYKKATNLKADEPDYHFQLGMIYMQTNALSDAATHFDKYLQLAPKGPNAAVAKDLSDAAKASRK